MLSWLVLSVALLGSSPGTEDADEGAVIDTVPAAEAGASPLANKQPLALTVSGGVSLGVYMAGFVYFTTELVKREGLPLELVLTTGASAGSANALVAAMSACSPPNPDPMSDLGWQVWTRADYRELYDPEEVTSTSLFSRRMLNLGIDAMKERFARGFPESCDTVVGFTTTRVEPYSVELSPGFEVPRLAEKFAFRLRGRGRGKVPSLENYADPTSSVELPLLPFQDGTDDETRLNNFEYLRQVMTASGAFPFAFAPQSIDHCLSVPSLDGERMSLSCPKDAIRHDEFLDGGVFDNTPLDLAYSLAQLGLTTEHHDSIWCSLDHSHEPEAGLANRVDYLYLDPWLTVYPALEKKEEVDRDRLLPLAADVVGNWVTAARSRELYSLVRERATLRKHMRLTRTQYPPASKPLGGFMGFFDWKFRHYDFYLGMYDAAVFFVGWAQRSGIEVGFEEFLPGGEVGYNWEPFACMVGYFEPGYEEWRTHCKGPDLEDFRILMQVGLDEIYSRCSDVKDPPVDSPHYHCARAARGAEPIRLAELAEPEGGSARLEEETPFMHRMRLLEAYGFWFEDLQLDRDEAWLGPVKLRRELLGMLTALADRQAPFEREVFLTGARSAINSIAYEPPKNWWYVVLGSSSEVGASLLPFDWDRSFARLNVAFGVDSLLSLVTFESDNVVFRAVAGPELELLFVTTPVVQPSIGLRGGYQLGHGDSFGTERCTEERSGGDGRVCSGWVAQGYGAINFLERFRIQFTGTWTPANPDFDRRNFAVGAAFGVQFF